MLALDGQVDLANQAMLLILAAAVAAIWWGPWLSAASIGAGVLAFNYAFVPPRGTLAVDLHHHGLLLVAMVTVSWLISALMSRVRRLAHAQQQAQLQAMRNTLLSAIAHDHRTPLATIASAAGALHDQDDKLDAAQRRRLAATILDEATQLARITDNTLQLARLDAAGLELAKDWESLEELVGSVMRRQRQRDPDRRLRAFVPNDLPLVRCNAVLIVQMLDNLVDNALRYGRRNDKAGPVDLIARAESGCVVLAVQDRGPGLPGPILAGSTAIFASAEHKRLAPGPADDSRRGTGVGLALCRAIARVHGGELRLRQRDGGGALIECVLPLEAGPGQPAASTSITSEVTATTDRGLPTS
jgi:two-component system sensor histidine kinase KdpD